MKKRFITLMLLLSMVMAGCAGKDGDATGATEVPGQSKEVEVQETSEGNLASDESSAAGEAIAVTWNGCEVAKQVYSAQLPTAKEKAEIYVEPIAGLSDDFIRGMDVSTVIVEEESGVTYRDENGNVRDLFEILADAGVNYIRVRVWNNPYDADGNGYGGGNCDVEKAAEIGRRAAEHGMKLLVDFHYSDFWADPNKQFAPKAWARKRIGDKETAIAQFTEESLYTILNAGADVGMVQIGNEINKGVCGTYEEADVMKLLSSASGAVRKVSSVTGREMQVAVHYTAVDDSAMTLKRAEILQNYGVDYDIFGISYYSYWHGSFENMCNVLGEISSKYGKKTCIMETAYPFTSDDGDMNGNSVGSGGVEGYPDSVQAQAKNFRDVAYYANEAGALGAFYWEGAWVPVGSLRESNEKIWEKYGSGWASSYSVDYDPQDAGQYYGGCAWDNQAMFDFSAKALPSLNVFKWLKYGTDAPLQVMEFKEVYIESGIGVSLDMPKTVDVYYNDPSVKAGMEVTWDADSLAAVNVNAADTYEVKGKAADGSSVTATVKVMNVNYVQNPGFDEADMSMWTVTDNGAGDTTDVQKKAADALSGDNAFHFYSTSAIDFTVEQEIKIAAGGEYAAVANIQGGDVGCSAEIYLYVTCGDKTYKSDPAKLSGWKQWQKLKVDGVPVKTGDVVKVGMVVKAAAKGWGTIDDIEFYALAQ